MGHFGVSGGFSKWKGKERFVSVVMVWFYNYFFEDALLEFPLSSNY